MFEPQKLNLDQIELCVKTISSNTFYMLVNDALLSNRNLSVVRMGDGERQIIDWCRKHDDTDMLDSHNAGWLNRLGCFGIRSGEIMRRLHLAGNDCTYFAPSVSGILHEGFHLHSLFKPRDFYVDNFFVNAWTEEMKIALFRTAKHVLFIHRNTAAADVMQIRAKYALDVKVTFLKLESWEQADDVIAKAAAIDAPLTLFSAGPASKYIGPAIAKGGRIAKVTIDIGNAADYWLLSSLKDIPAGRR